MLFGRFKFCDAAAFRTAVCLSSPAAKSGSEKRVRVVSSGARQPLSADDVFDYLPFQLLFYLHVVDEARTECTPVLRIVLDNIT